MAESATPTRIATATDRQPGATASWQAIPPAERERRTRILQAAEAMLAREGVHGLQMKPLASRANVALGTLYRYFPSKDHLLAAVLLERHLRSLARIDTLPLDGETAGARAATVLLREFQSAQRNPEFVGPLLGAVNAGDRATSEYVEAIVRALEEMLLAAVARGQGAATAEQLAVLPIVQSASNDAMMQWMRGTLSADEARERIRHVARLLDLPPDIVRTYLV